jgi:fatty-acyl-CoA synthase/long-chain acyl-CoA synthetase
LASTVLPGPFDAEANVEGETMIYTSGTTGKPKGAVRSTNADNSTVIALVTKLQASADDVYIATGPLYHSGPGGFLILAHTLANTVVVQRKFDAEDWLRLVDRYKVSTTFTAPTPIRMVTALPAAVKARYSTASMRVLIANAAPWTMALKEAYLADFPPSSLFEVYGSTELGVNCLLLPEDQLRKRGSCGQAAPLVEIKLFDDDGNEVTGVGPEHTGELYVRNPNNFAGYYKRDGDANDVRGEYRTVGDIAYRDDEGFYYICDRKKDMIISGGMNVYSVEVESVIDDHPAVYEVAVFGIPSEDWGEAVHAVVVPKPGASLTEAEVIAYAREHLAHYKAPRSVSFADDLPKTGSGKVLKRELRAPYWEGYSRAVG